MRWLSLPGRDTGQTLERHFVYRVSVPTSWKVRLPSPADSIADSTKPNAEFFIDDVIITIHNFPVDRIDQRVPPEAQVARWQRQQSEPGIVEPSSHGGFAGLFFESHGQKSVMAWAMQLGMEHYQNLRLTGSTEQMEYFKQMRADYTIKAVGPKDSLEKLREALFLFASSFELIEEIPARL